MKVLKELEKRSDEKYIKKIRDILSTLYLYQVSEMSQ